MSFLLRSSRDGVLVIEGGDGQPNGPRPIEYIFDVVDTPEMNDSTIGDRFVWPSVADGGWRTDDKVA